ncbi:MAG: hypothetical protein ACR2QM_19070 [Longimicrobiales bacterium]
MKTFGKLTLAAFLAALVVGLPACGGGEPESDDMQAFLVDGDDAEFADLELDQPLDGEAGGSGGSDLEQETGFGDPEVGSVDLEIPQQSTPAPRPAPEPEPEPVVEEPLVSLHAGTQIALSSDLELSTEKVIAGDPITATVSDDVLDAEGEIVIPAGAQLLGRVVTSEESSGSDVDPVLEIQFETLSTGEWERAIYASVVEVEMESSRKDSDKRTAAKIGGAAAAGAILGKVLGKDTEDAVKGGVAGAVAGTVIAMEMRAGHAKIKEGALIVIELTDPLIVQ